MGPEMDGEQQKGWHLEKSITVGQIFTIAVILVTGIGYVVNNEKRLALMKENLRQETEARKVADENLQKRLGRMEERTARRFKVIQESLLRIEDKLDRKADKE